MYIAIAIILTILLILFVEAIKTLSSKQKESDTKLMKLLIWTALLVWTLLLLAVTYCVTNPLNEGKNHETEILQKELHRPANHTTSSTN
jgi:hypothetical protein